MPSVYPYKMVKKAKSNKTILLRFSREIVMLIPVCILFYITFYDLNA